MTQVTLDNRTEPQKEIDRQVLMRVREGLKWLEETHGPGWEDKISMDRLDLSDGCFCVLGQVYREEAKGTFSLNNGYTYARERLGLSGKVTQLGFNVSSVNRDWFELTCAWKQVLADKEYLDERA